MKMILYSLNEALKCALGSEVQVSGQKNEKYGKQANGEEHESGFHGTGKMVGQTTLTDLY